MNSLHIGVIQLTSGTNINDNLSACDELITAAAARGARLVFTPEMTSVIDKTPGKVKANAMPEATDTALLHLCKLAAELNIDLFIGSLPIRVAKNRCVNRSYHINSSGKVVNHYDKIHMFDASLNSRNTYKESDDYHAGQQAVITTVDDATIGLSICYDIRFSALYTALALAGAKLIAVPAAFTAITGAAHWEVLLRARAIETGTFIIAAAQAGKHQDGRRTHGHSMIINPWGEVVAKLAQEPGVLDAVIDLDEVNNARQKIPSLQHIKTFSPPAKN